MLSGTLAQRNHALGLLARVPGSGVSWYAVRTYKSLPVAEQRALPVADELTTAFVRSTLRAPRRGPR